jgi:hypothetical protein
MHGRDLAAGLVALRDALRAPQGDGSGREELKKNKKDRIS